MRKVEKPASPPPVADVKRKVERPTRSPQLPAVEMPAPSKADEVTGAGKAEMLARPLKGLKVDWRTSNTGVLRLPLTDKEKAQEEEGQDPLPEGPPLPGMVPNQVAEWRRQGVQVTLRPFPWICDVDTWLVGDISIAVASNCPTGPRRRRDVDKVLAVQQLCSYYLLGRCSSQSCKGCHVLGSTYGVAPIGRGD